MARKSETDEKFSGDVTGDVSGEASESAPARRPPELPDEESRVIAKLRTMPPDTRTKIWRVDERTKDWQTHGVLSPDEVSSEWISKRFGGGVYKIRVVDREKGPHVFAITSTWTIPGPYKGVGRGLPGIDDQPPGPGEAAEPAPVRDGRVPTRELLDNALASRVMDILNRDTRPSMDWTGLAAMITAVGGILAPVIERMVDRKPGADPMLTDIRDELRAMREKPGPTSTALADALHGVRDVIRLRDVLDGRNPGEGKAASMEERIVGMVPDILAAFTGKTPPAQLAPAPIADGQHPPVPAQGIDGTPPWERLLVSFRDQLLYMANNGWEPEYCAELVQRALPGEHVGLLVEFLQKPDAEAREIVVRAIPELGAFEKWVPAFLAELRRLMLPDESDEEPEK